MEEDLASFVAVTGADEHVARQLLDMGGSLDQAIMLYYETDMAETLQRQATTAGTTTATTSATRSRSTAGRQDTAGVIHIDSDDDDGYNFDGDAMDENDDDDLADDDDGQDQAHERAQDVARTAQEEEDAAMAKRLQEEMYAETGGAGMDEDAIRAPIARTTEVLVEPAFGGYGSDGLGGGTFGGGAFGGLIGGGGGGGGGAPYEFRPPRARRRNPFDQVWDDGTAAADAAGGADDADPDQPRTRAAHLADLFRPPYSLMAPLRWDEARIVGKEKKRWILANLQDMSDFQCQALNRDIWKDRAVRDLVRDNFVFLQFDKEDPVAEPYIQYYLPGGQHEDPNCYPHVAIVDPRTGEQVKVWSERPFPAASVFHAQLAEFLDRYSLDGTRKNPVQTTKPRAPRDVGRMTEEEMLEMALQNSLATGPAGGVQDPDALTEKVEEGAAAADHDHDDHDHDSLSAAVDEPDASAAAFARIAADHPHEEPANGPTTTRIQFRHATGRVIRRFAVTDAVERLYEWLKAAPLEGHEGEAFELKVVPPGHDLLEDLDKTIEEAGLKQATVMIEYA